MERAIICVVFLLGLVYAAELPELPQLPEGIVSKDDIEKVIRTKCEQKGGPNAFNDLKDAGVTLKDCIQGLGNVTVFQDELEEAKKTGSMDEVFGKYCAKTPQVKECIKNFRVHLEACMDDTEKNALNATLEIVKRLGEFLCYKDGDRLAMFIAEGGVECLNSKKEEIKNCVNATYFEKVSAQVSSNSLTSFLIDTEKCSDFGKLRDCVVEELEKCSDSTPANIIEALFKFIYRNTCKGRSKRSTQHKKLAIRDLEETLYSHRLRKRSSSSSSSSDCDDDKDEKNDKENRLDKHDDDDHKRNGKNQKDSSSSSSSSSESDEKKITINNNF